MSEINGAELADAVKPIETSTKVKTSRKNNTGTRIARAGGLAVAGVVLALSPDQGATPVSAAGETTPTSITTPDPQIGAARDIGRAITVSQLNEAKASATPSKVPATVTATRTATTILATATAHAEATHEEAVAKRKTEIVATMTAQAEKWTPAPQATAKPGVVTASSIPQPTVKEAPPIATTSKAIEAARAEATAYEIRQATKKQQDADQMNEQLDNLKKKGLLGTGIALALGTTAFGAKKFGKGILEASGNAAKSLKDKLTSPFKKGGGSTGPTGTPPASNPPSGGSASGNPQPPSRWMP